MTARSAAVSPLLDAEGIRPALPSAPARSRPRFQLVAFAALGLYGVIRWSTLETGAPWWRLLAALAVSVLVAGAIPNVARRSRLLAAPGAVLAALACLPLAGIPLAWVVHLRVAVSANAIGEGLSALPQVFVPYKGINESVRIVILLGADVLLVCAGLLSAFVRAGGGQWSRMWVALPLVVLAAVPSTLVHPRLPYLQGAVLFALLAAFLWADHVQRDQVAATLVLGALAAACATLLAPALDAHKPWIDYEALAGSFRPSAIESFDWSQGYGPLDWPRTGRPVLAVRAAHPAYWKAEDLDLFDGQAWTQGLVPGAQAAPQPSPQSIGRWSQRLEVTIRDMQTTDVIAAGLAARPMHLSQAVVPGYSPGTWTAGGELGPGDTYVTEAYTPRPTASQLAAAGRDYPDGPLADYRAIALPQTSGSFSAPQIVFPPFHSGLPVGSTIGLPTIDGYALVNAGPYARAFALARRLAGEARTPYAYVLSVERYLSAANGFSYGEHPPRRSYPLASFLFSSKVGYCQHFAGAMALLLRMGGVPARVAVGFTTGTFDSATHRWVATDLDAHAWVEAWFPSYGWVPFDPTPGAAPARSASGSIPALGGTPGRAGLVPHRGRGHTSPLHAAGPSARHARASSDSFPTGPLAIALVTVLLALAGLGLATGHRLGKVGVDRLLAELERAFARSGRPIPAGMTLAALEHRFRASQEATAYLRALRLSRFSARSEVPTPRQRRALRAQLRAGLGLWGALRALWALPPRWRPPWTHASS